MLEENNNAKMSEPESTEDETKKLSEDARSLGPNQAGLIRIGVVDMIIGEGGGLEVPGFVATKNEILQLVLYWASEILNLDFGVFHIWLRQQQCKCAVGLTYRNETRALEL